MFTVNAQFIGRCLHFNQSMETEAMKNEAAKAVEKKISPVEGEQGAVKEAGSTPPPSYGHGSASSGGTSGQIPKDA